MPLLVRVDCRAVVAAPRKRRQPGRAHAPLGGERRDPRDVERAPGAAGLARCEADAIALRVDRLPQPINPAKAERFIDLFGPGEAGLARILLIVADPQLPGRGVVFLQPGLECCWYG